MRLKESNIRFVKDVFFHGVLLETYVAMTSRNVSDGRTYYAGRETPATVHKFCAKRKAEVFHEEDEYGLRVIIYRK